MKRFKFCFVLFLCISIPLTVKASIKPNTVPDVLYEDTLITLKSNFNTRISTARNPIKVSVLTVDNQTIELAPVITKINRKGGKQAQVRLPKLPDLGGNIFRIVLRISGGNVPEDNPEDFARLLVRLPEGVDIDQEPPFSDNPDLLSSPTLSAETDPGVIQLPDTYPGENIVGDVPSALLVTAPEQPAITTLLNLANIGNGTNTVQINGNVNVDGALEANMFVGDLEGTAKKAKTAEAALNAGFVSEPEQSAIESLPNLSKLGSDVDIDGDLSVAGSVEAQEYTGSSLNIASISAAVGPSDDGAITPSMLQTFIRIEDSIDAGDNSITAASFKGDLDGTAQKAKTAEAALNAGFVSESEQPAITDLPNLETVGNEESEISVLADLNLGEHSLSADTLRANNFLGDLEGNAATASEAETATSALIVTAPEQPNILLLPAIQKLGSDDSEAPLEVLQAVTVDGDLDAGENTIKAATFMGDLMGNANAAVLVTEPVQSNITELPNISFIGSREETLSFMTAGTNIDILGFLTVEGDLKASNILSNNEDNSIDLGNQEALVNVPGRLVVSNIGSSGEDGVSIDLGEKLEIFGDIDAGENTVKATTFMGDLMGNAKTATEAETAASADQAKTAAIVTAPEQPNILILPAVQKLGSLENQLPLELVGPTLVNGDLGIRRIVAPDMLLPPVPGEDRIIPLETGSPSIAVEADLDASGHTITAATFKGDLEGNAATATESQTADEAATAVLVTAAEQANVESLPAIKILGTEASDIDLPGTLKVAVLGATLTGDGELEVDSSSEIRIVSSLNAEGQKITADEFIGNLTGDVTGNADSATFAQNAEAAQSAVSAATVSEATQEGITELPNVEKLGAEVEELTLGNDEAGSLVSVPGTLVINTLSAPAVPESAEGELAAAQTNPVIKVSSDIDATGRTITAATFVGNLTGSLTGNASNATRANIANSANIASTVSGPVQNSIRSLPNLSILGRTGFQTTVPGVLRVTSGEINATGRPVRGNFIGNLNGTASRASLVTGSSQNSIRQLANLSTIGRAGFNTVVPGNLNVTGSINATGRTVRGNFVGNLSGRASSALSATNANISNVARRLDSGSGQFLTATGNQSIRLNATAPTVLNLPNSGTIATTDGLTPISVDTGLRNINGAGLTTLDVDGKNLIRVTDSAPSAGDVLQGFTGGQPGQRLTIIFVGNPTLVRNRANVANRLILAHSGDQRFFNGDTLELIFDGSLWFEISRSDNR